MGAHDSPIRRQAPCSPGRRWFRRRPAVAGALAALVAWAVPVLAQAAACQLQALELPVSMVGSRAVATVGVNGSPVALTVDSGAFFSILTEAAAQQLGLSLTRNFNLRVDGLTGSIVTYTTRVDKLQLLKGEIPRVEFLVGGNEPGAGTMGLMGRNLLSLFDTEYDLAHGVIRFMFPNDDCGHANMAYWSGSTPVTEVDLVRDYRNSRTPAIRAQVKVNGQELVALLDTGATTLLSSRAAARAGVAESAMTRAGTVHGGGRGSAKAWTAPFERFEIGGEAVLHNHLRVADFSIDDADLLLGIDFFLSHRIYISKKQSKMYLTYNGGPVFALDKSESVGAIGFDAEPAGAGTVTSASAPASAPASGDSVVAAASGSGGGGHGVGAASAASSVTADQFARRGAASAARRDFEGALADLNRACELEPATPAWFAQRGAIQIALRHPEQALDDFDKALELDPMQADARLRRAGLRSANKNRAGALSDLEALDNTLAPQSQMRLEMARIYLSLDQPRQALAEWAQWLPAHPHEVDRDAVRASRCWNRLRLGIELDEALDDCNAAVDSDAKNAVYLNSRGWLQLRLGNARKAFADFDRSVDARPRWAWPLYGRGLARERQGEGAQGAADIAAARQIHPEIDRDLAQSGVMAGAAAAPP